MGARTRSKTYQGGKVGYYQATSNPTSKTYYGSGPFTETMSDWVGAPWSENLMSSTYRSYTFMPINGNASSGTLRLAKDMPPSCVRGNPSYPPISTPPDSGFRNAMQALADSHPGEPALALPVFLFELKDMPGMLKHAKGRAQMLAAKARANGYRDVRRYLNNPRNPSEDWLNYHFGWLPFINDLAATADVADWVKQRSKMLRKVGRKKYITRRSNLGVHDYEVSSGTITYDTTLGSWFGTQQTSGKATRWLVSHWRVDPLQARAVLESRSRLLRQAVGFDVSLTHVWDALPWSWLVDWFTEVGNYIHVRSNRLGITFKNSSIMTHSVIRRRITPSASSNYKAGDVNMTLDVKHRLPYSPTMLPGGFNLLGPGQLATLAALKCSKIPKSFF